MRRPDIDFIVNGKLSPSNVKTGVDMRFNPDTKRMERSNYPDPKIEKAKAHFAARCAAFAPKVPHDGPCMLKVTIYRQAVKSPKWKRESQLMEKQVEGESWYCTSRPDWDNCGKTIGDALEGMFWKNDSQIVDAWVSKRYAEFSKVRVQIWLYKQPLSPKERKQMSFIC